jgi:hypothetical protein
VQQFILHRNLFANLKKLTVMKKTWLLFFVFVFVSATLSAKIKKGSIMLGLDFAFNGSSIKQEVNNNETKNSTTNFSASLLAGKAVKENLFFGAGVSYSTTTFTPSGGQAAQKTNGFGGSVWGRKYFPITGPLLAFVNGSIYVNTASNKNDNPNSYNTNALGLGVALYPGLSLHVKKSFYLDASLNNLANIYYTRTKVEQSGGGSSNIQTSVNYGFSTSLGNDNNPLQLGIRWIIAGKK